MEALSPETSLTKATVDDFEALKDLMSRANEHSIAKSGLPMWTAMDHAYSKLMSQIKGGDLYVVRNEDGLISSSVGFALTEENSEWGEAVNDGKAVYFYKWMKDPNLAKPKESLAMLEFVAEYAISHGRSLMRCDTVAELPGLIDYYKKLGFTVAGNFVYDSSGRDGLLLEAPAEAVLERIKDLND